MSAIEERDLRRRRERRAPMACEFCRRRKMRCNNERPECGNCKEHGKACIYAELIKKPRPSSTRINQLEQENCRLRDDLANLKASSAVKPPGTKFQLNLLPSIPCGRSSAAIDQRQVATPSSTSSAVTPLQRTFSPDQDSCYHGPTSTIFDEKSSDSVARHQRTDGGTISEIWVNRQLIAESSKQRQLETVNFLSGRLDFDGVDPELGKHLLEIYWSRQQSFGPVVYRTAFMRDMACNGPYFSKLLLNSIYFYASKYSPATAVRRDPNNSLTAGWEFRQKVSERLSACFEESSITTIQALLIMSSALFSWCDEKSTSWLYSGMAFRMILDLGINVNAATLRRQLSEEEVEIRVRLFWAAFVIDKLQSLYQGRPTSLRESETNLHTYFLDEYEELELFDSFSYAEAENPAVSPAYTISTFAETCKLNIILERILLSLYSEKSKEKDVDDLMQESKLLDAELQVWRESLPKHIDIDMRKASTWVLLPHTLALLSMYNILVILLHRPFVSDGHLHSASSAVPLDAFSKCSSAAFEITQALKKYEDHFCLKVVPYILSYATYVGATILVRIAAQSEPGSQAHCALRKCVDVLESQEPVCWSARRAKTVISKLISKMHVVISIDDILDLNDTSILPDLDIDAIMQTFTYLPTGSYNSHQSLDADPNNAGLSMPNRAASDLVTVDTNETGLDNLHPPLSSDDVAFLYDPIFGFNGSAFDDFDFGSTGSFLPEI